MGNESVPDKVLQDLKTIWEEKLAQSGVLPALVNPMMYPGAQNYIDPYNQRMMMTQRYTGGQPPRYSFPPPNMPQGDGPTDDEFALDSLGFSVPGGTNDDDLNSPEGNSSAPEDDDDEEPLDSDLDDEDEEPAPTDYILCQFDKVSRVKNRHKCQLKDGIMHLNG